MSSGLSKGIGSYKGEENQSIERSKRVSKKRIKSVKKQHVPYEEELIEEYYSRGVPSEMESEVGNPHRNSLVSPDMNGLSRMKRIVLDLREELTQLTGRMSLQGEKRFSYHQKLLFLENELDKLMKAKEGFVPSLPVVLLDQENSLLKKDREIIDLERRINLLEERILSNQLETQKEMSYLVDEIKRKDRIIQNFNDKVMAEVAASKALQQCIDKIKDNLFRYRSQIGSIQRFVLQGVEFPNVGSYHIRPQVLAMDNMNYSRNRWVTEYRNHMLILFRQLERLHSNPDSVTEAALERIIEGFLTSLQGSNVTEIYKNATINIRKMKDKFSIASALIQSSIDRLRLQYPDIVIGLDTELMNTIGNQHISINRIQNGVVFLDRVQQILIEVPVIQQRNIMVAPTQVIDVHLSEQFTIEADRLKNTAFHLRALIKALLQQLEKMKQRTGYPLQIDERVIAMINQEAGGIIDLQDVLRVFQVRGPSEHIIIEQQPERIIQVPEVVIVDKVVQKIVQVQRIRQVEKIVNVPIEVPHVVQNIIQKLVPVQRIVQRIVEVPVHTEKIVQMIVQVPKILEVQRVIQVPVQVQKIIQIQRVVNRIIPQPEQIDIIQQKIIPVHEIIQKIIQVPTIVQKIVQRVIKVPQIIQIQVIVQKIVQVQRISIVPQMTPHVQIKHQIIQKIIQKPIPIIQYQQRIVQVPQVIQKIVQVCTTKQTVIQVQVIRQVFVTQEIIKQIQIQVQKPVIVYQQVQKVVQKFIEVPVVVQRVIKVPEIITKPIIQKTIETIIKQIEIQVPVIVNTPQIIQVQKIINHYIEVPNIVKTYEDRIVEVPVYVDRIKEVRVQVDKIIEKLVEVPKVIQVQKLVEKIVVVPRVIEKIVEVPQVAEVIVDRIIQKQIIVEVEKIIEIPIMQESIREIEVQKNVYIPVEKVFDRVVEKLVECPVYQQKVIHHEVIQQKVVEVVREIPKEIEVPHIVTNFIEKEKVIEIEKNVIIPIQVPVPVEAIIEKVVPIYELRQNIIQVPQIIQKIVEVRVEDVQVVEVVETVDNYIVDKQIVTVPELRVVVEKQIDVVDRFIQKIVPVTNTVDNIVPRQLVVEKAVQVTVQIPKVYQIQKIVQKLVQVPQVMQIQTPVPQIIRVKEVVQKIIQKIVPIPTIMQQIVQVPVQKQKIVAINTVQQQIVQVQRIIQKPIILQKLKQVINDIHHIQYQLQIVDRIQNVPVPIVSKQQRIITVPQMLQKIVQRIVIMPQVKEVLKYVHQITEVQTLGAAVSQDISIQQSQYKTLIGNVTQNINIIIQQLRRMVISQPHLQGHIQMLISLLVELDKLNRFSRVVSVPVEKIVQKPVQVKQVITVPVQSQSSLRKEIALAVLTQKLITELVRIKRSYPNVEFNLEQDIKLILLPQLQMQPGNLSQDFQSRLMEFSGYVTRKFQSLGNWTSDHQVMLNSFLQQRFVMANMLKQANLEMDKIRIIGEKRLQGLRRYKTSKTNYEMAVNQLLQIMPQFMDSVRNVSNTSQYTSRIQIILNRLMQVQKTGGFIYSQPTKTLQDLKITDQRILSLLRQKQYQIFSLRQKLTSFQKHRATTLMDPNIMTINQLNRQIQSLKTMNASLKNQMDFINRNNPQLKNKMLNDQILRLEQDKADLQNELFNLKNQLETHINFANAQIEQYKIRLSNSAVTTIPGTSPRRFTSGVTNSFNSPTHLSGQFSPRNPTESLQYSQTPYSSEIPATIPTIQTSILPTYSMSMSSERTQPNNFYEPAPYQSSYTARDRMYSPNSIPENISSQISRTQNQPPMQLPTINTAHVSYHEEQRSDDTRSLSVPGVNYDISQYNGHSPVAPQQIIYENNQNSALNQPQIETSYRSPVPLVVYPNQQQRQAPFQKIDSRLGDYDLPNINRNDMRQSVPFQSPRNSQYQSSGMTQSLQQPTFENHLSSHQATIPAVVPIVIPETTVSNADYYPNPMISSTHSNQQPIPTIPLNQQSKMLVREQSIKFQSQKSNHNSDQFQLPVQQNYDQQLHSNISSQKLQSHVSDDQQIPQLPSQHIPAQTQESIPELHSQSQPLIQQNSSESNQPWPQSPNYDGLQHLSNSNRESSYSQYSGYSDKKQSQK